MNLRFSLILSALSLSSVKSWTSSSSDRAATSAQGVSRSRFLSQGAAIVAASFATPALAKEVDASLKGTKKDPEYEACVGKCLYECTKPKVPEQKSRAECIPECKQQCATSKQQLMIGNPISR